MHRAMLTHAAGGSGIIRPEKEEGFPGPGFWQTSYQSRPTP